MLCMLQLDVHCSFSEKNLVKHVKIKFTGATANCLKFMHLLHFLISRFNIAIGGERLTFLSFFKTSKCELKCEKSAIWRSCTICLTKAKINVFKKIEWSVPKRGLGCEENILTKKSECLRTLGRQGIFHSH